MVDYMVKQKEEEERILREQQEQAETNALLESEVITNIGQQTIEKQPPSKINETKVAMEVDDADEKVMNEQPSIEDSLLQLHNEIQAEQISLLNRSMESQN